MPGHGAAAPPAQYVSAVKSSMAKWQLSRTRANDSSLITNVFADSIEATSSGHQQPTQSGSTSMVSDAAHNAGVEPDAQRRDAPSQTEERAPAARAENMAVEIIRQVEYYFSDENLPHDAHMLALTGGEGNGPAPVREIFRFKKMREFKERGATPNQMLDILQRSETVQVVATGLQRRQPLTLPLTVAPRQSTILNMQKSKKTSHYTNRMLEPTGFEEGACPYPAPPSEGQDDKKLFDPEEAFVVRIENAVTRFCHRRKMHQLVRSIFTRYMTFCGFSAGPQQFTGGLTREDLESMDNEQIEMSKAQFTVLPTVFEGIDEDIPGAPTWVVNFEVTTQAFLSSRFMHYFQWTDAGTVSTACKVLRSFFTFLQYHSVCPEYDYQLWSARSVCDAMEAQFHNLAKLDKHLPGAFNRACSVLRGGYCARTADIDFDDATGRATTDASQIMREQAYKLTSSILFAPGLVATSTLWSDDLPPLIRKGFEIVSTEKAAESDTVIMMSKNAAARDMSSGMGRLYCRSWHPPQPAPMDMPKAAQVQPANDTLYTFVIDNDTLQYCLPGIKFEADIGDLGNGVCYFDRIEALYPQSFIWIPNEVVFRTKEIGPPKAKATSADAAPEEKVSENGSDNSG